MINKILELLGYVKKGSSVSFTQVLEDEVWVNVNKKPKTGSYRTLTLDSNGIAHIKYYDEV